MSAFTAGALRPADGRLVVRVEGPGVATSTCVGGDRVAERAGWFYPSPTAATRRSSTTWRSTPGRWTAAPSTARSCAPQPGGFYGGWVTSTASSARSRATRARCSGERLRCSRRWPAARSSPAASRPPARRSRPAPAGTRDDGGAQPGLVPDDRDRGADQRRGGVELAAEHQRHPAGRARRGRMPPPMPVSIPISAAGTGPSPNSSALSAPVTQNSASPAASSTLITRSMRPERRVEEEGHQARRRGHQQVAPVRQRRRRRTAPMSTSRRKPPPSPVDAGQHQHREHVELLADRRPGPR